LEAGGLGVEGLDPPDEPPDEPPEPPVSATTFLPAWIAASWTLAFR